MSHDNPTIAFGGAGFGGMTSAALKFSQPELITQQKGLQRAIFDYHLRKLKALGGMVRIPDVDVPAVILAYSQEAPDGS